MTESWNHRPMAGPWNDRSVTGQERPALIGLAHGSRDPRAAVAVRSLMAAVARLLPRTRCAAAFLELSTPGLGEVAGGERAVVVPLLFTTAFHAVVDVPRQVDAVGRDTGAVLDIAEPLGLGTFVLDALKVRADHAGIADRDEICLLAVGSSRPGADESVARLAARWSASRRGPVTAGFATSTPRATVLLRAARAGGERPAIVPLFLAPGLLLDQVLGDPAAENCVVAEVLGDLMAPLVVQRYLDALSRSRTGDQLALV